MLSFEEQAQRRKLTRLRTQQIPQTFKWQFSESTNEEYVNLEVEEICFAKQPQREGVLWDPHCGKRLLQTKKTYVIVAKSSMFLLTVQIQEKSDDIFLVKKSLARFCQFLEKKITADEEDEIILMNFILVKDQQTLNATYVRRKQLKQTKSNW